MKLYIKLSLILFMVNIISACGYLNPLIGYENGFEWRQNSYIGESVDEYILDYELNIEDRKITYKDNFEVHKLVLRINTHKDYTAHECVIEQDIDTKTRTILSWRYISERSECLEGYFFEGVLN